MNNEELERMAVAWARELNEESNMQNRRGTAQSGFKAGYLKAMQGYLDAMEMMAEELEEAREVISEYVEAMASAMDDMNHYIDNECLPVSAEINSLGITLNHTRAFMEKWKAVEIVEDDSK